MIISPKYLRRDIEVVINTEEKTIHLVSHKEDSKSNIENRGEKNKNGVTFQALYSFLKNSWRDHNDLIGMHFPMNSSSHQCFEMINGWKLTEDSYSLLRNGHCYQDGENVASDELFKWNVVGSRDPEVSYPLLLRSMIKVNGKEQPFHCVGHYDFTLKKFEFQSAVPVGTTFAEVTHFIEIKDPSVNGGKLVENPDDLNFGVEVLFDVEKKEVKLVGRSKNLDSNIFDFNYSEDSTGVSYKAFVSFTLEEWRTNKHLMLAKPPINNTAWTAKDVSEFELGNDWKFADDYSKNLLRNGRSVF